MRSASLLLFLFPLFTSAQTLQEKYDEFFTVMNTDIQAAHKLGNQLLNEMPKDTAYADVCYYMAYGYFYLGEYQNAINYSIMEKDVREKIKGSEHDTYLGTVYNLAIYYSYASDFSSSAIYMEEVVAAMKKKYAKTDLNFLNITNQLAGLYAGAGALHKAEEIYEENYEIIRSTFPPTDSVYQQMSNTIATFYTQNARYDKSIPFFLMACDMQEKYYTKKSNEYMASYNSLGEIYIYAGMYDKAEVVYTDFVKLSESFYGKKSADYATALNNLAVSYEKQNKFVEAEKLYLKSLAIKEKVYTKNSDFYALTLVNLGVVYDYLGNYTKAEKVLNEAITIYETFYKEDNGNYATALNNIASIYASSGKYEKAIEVLKKSLEINKKMYGENSVGYLISLNGLGSAYLQMENIDEAEKIFTEAAPLYEKVLGKYHPDYGIVLFNLANVNTAKGNYPKAIEFLEKDLSIQNTAVGKIHINYAQALQAMASVYGILGQYRKAEELYNETSELYTKLYGKMHPDYAIFLNNYGMFLFNKGDIQNSEEKLLDAWGIQAAAFGQDHPDNISVLCNLANVQVQKNLFKEAEINLFHALKIAKTYYKPEDSQYSTTLNNLAVMYYELANYDKAEEYYKNALELRKKFYGEKHTEYAVTLNNLGALYLTKANEAKPEFQKALATKSVAYFKEALAIDSLALGGEHVERASHLNNLAEAYRLMNMPEAAEKLYEQCIALEEKNWGKDNPKSAVSYHNLALLYAGWKNYDKAEESALISIRIFEKNYGSNAPASTMVTSSLAFIYESKNENEKAKEKYLQALKIQRDLLEKNFTFLSESEKESYSKSVSQYNDMYNTFALKIKEKDPSVVDLVYNNELFNKGLLFRSSTRVKDIILESKDDELIELYNSWMDTRQEISILYSTPVEERKNNIHDVEEKANELEKQLVVKADYLKNEISMTQGEWTSVKSKLKPGQAAIEFIHFMHNDDYKEELYAALLITPNSIHPEMIELFTEKELQEIIGKNTATTYESVSGLYGKQKMLNEKLYSLIWAPLEKSLTGVTEIFYSPSGMLHKVSIAALGGADGKYVSDKYNLHQLNSTVALLDMAAVKIEPSKSMMAVVGGVKYDTDKSTQHVWSYLPGTLTESENINAALTKAGVKTELLSADNATEENLKKMDGATSPDILHVATHGFFFGDPEEEKAKIEKQVSAVKFRGESRGVKSLVENPNPLMRSGIVLAGANDVWNDSKIVSEKEDGILTAYEVSLMNLSNTKLVVLSACETGLGDIKGSEGVYGLQRAFRIAGADLLIMSLWQVPDKETEEFMTSFYNELIKTKEIRKAFANAQKLMRTKYDPFFWGAFVLIE